MSQAEFRIGPNGQKQKLNHNRRWENVESGSTKASQHSPGSSVSDVSSDFSNPMDKQNSLTPEEKDEKQIEYSVNFVNYLLEEGRSPEDILSDKEETDEYLTSYCETIGKEEKAEEEYDFIIAELEKNNNFARAYKKIFDEETKYDKQHQEELSSRALESAQTGYASLESSPDMKAIWAADMFSGVYEGTYEDFYADRAEDVYLWQREDVDSLINEWESRMEKDGEPVEYVHISSDNAGWRNYHAEGILSIDELKVRSNNPIGLRGDASFDWVQNKDGKTIDIDVYHHDSPTGEQWKIRGLTPEEEEYLQQD